MMLLLLLFLGGEGGAGREDDGELGIWNQRPK